MLKTLKVSDGGDLCFCEASTMQLIDNEEAVSQAVRSLIGTRLGEFKLDEFIGMDMDFMGEKRVEDDYIFDAILEALQPLTDQGIIEGVESADFRRENRKLYIENLIVLMTDGENIVLERIEIDD